MYSSCPPPKRFVAAVDVEYAKFLAGKPPFIRRGKSRGRYAVGVKYERRAQEYLGRMLASVAGSEFRVGPWLEFRDKSGKRWCQLDALGLVPERKLGIIYEIKYQHTSDAWWQLKWLYWPVLQCAMPGYTFGLVEVCHWHDPAAPFPERYDLAPSPLRSSNGRVGVHIYNPRRENRLSGIGQGGGPRTGEAPSSQGPVAAAE